MSEKNDSKKTSVKRQTNSDADKNQAAVELGKLGGVKGGPARDRVLSADRKSAIAKQGAKARWSR